MKPACYVSGNVTNAFVNQIVWLPDHNRRYTLQINSGWGPVNGSVKLQNGWMLDTLGAQSDSKIPETIAAVGGLVAAVPKGQKTVSPLVAALTEGLYRIDIGSNGEVSFQRTGQVIQ